MKKIFTVAVLTALSGTALVAQVPAPTTPEEIQAATTTALKDFKDSKNALENSIKGFVSASQALSSMYRNQLHMFNKEKGWGTNVYPKIVQADHLLDTINKKIDALQRAQKNPETVQKALDTVGNAILTIAAMAPVPSTRYPERCGDTNLASTYTVYTNGEIMKGLTSSTWVFRPSNCENEGCYIPLLSQTGQIGNGDYALPTYLRGKPDITAWVENNTVVCAGPDQK